MESRQQDKICVICHEDCSMRPRKRDTKGRYYCAACYDAAAERVSDRRRAGRATVARDDAPNRGPANAGPGAIMSGLLDQTALPAICPTCGRAGPTGAVVCVFCGFDDRVGTVHVSRVEPERSIPSGMTSGRWDDILAHDREASALARRYDYLKAVVLLIAGFGMVAMGTTSIAEGATATGLVFGHTIGLAIETAVGLVGLWLAATIWLGGAGPIGLAALRLAGIYAFIDGLIMISPLNFFVTWVAVIGLYVLMLAWLFDLDGRDAGMLALVTLLLKIAAGVVLVTIAL